MSSHEYADAYVSNLDKVPKEKHWAIITQSAHDDGYGGSADHIEYAAFFTKEKFIRQVEYLETKTSYFREKYKAIEVNPVVIEVRVKVEIEV